MTSASPDRVVVVGASLAGLTAAETLREQGYAGRLTVVSDEPHEPYDRPPLSKSVLAGRQPVTGLSLPRRSDLDVEWVLGVPATGLDRSRRRVLLADGREIAYDRVLVATGTRARPWPDTATVPDGVFTLRTREDADRLRQRLVAGPARVLVVGAGFTGSEIASVCRELDLEVTVAERGGAPLAGALGDDLGAGFARRQLAHGVDLRCGTSVTSLEGDGGRLARARLSDGSVLDIDVAVVALGAIRNVEWLAGAGLSVDGRGVVCDRTCRVLDAHGTAVDEVLVAGDVARWPHPLFGDTLLAVEHWGNARGQGRVAGHNLVCAPDARRAHETLPAFWSHQFGLNIKSVGLPSYADRVVVTQGSVEQHRYTAALGRDGRMVAAVAVDMPRNLDAYAAMIRARASFPPDLHAPDEE